MAGSFSDFLELELLDHVLGAATYSPPATVYVGLYTAAPTDAGGGTEVSTGDWSNYSRIDVTNNATNWPAAAAGAKSNGTAMSFGAATIVTPVTVVAFGIFDADTAGNLLMWADLAVNKTINNGDTPSFAIGDIDVTLT